jgi:hypothetical protein
MWNQSDSLVDIGGLIRSLAAFSGEQSCDSAVDSFPLRRMVCARFQSECIKNLPEWSWEPVSFL